MFKQNQGQNSIFVPEMKKKILYQNNSKIIIMKEEPKTLCMYDYCVFFLIPILRLTHVQISWCTACSKLSLLTIARTLPLLLVAQ